jgi:DNA repair protein RecO
VAEQVLPEHETAESMFRLMLLTVREIERTGAWQLPLSYFVFWAVRLGGYLPPFDRCAKCGTMFGEDAAFHAPWEPGLLCEKCKRPGMRALHLDGRKLAERFAGERLDKIEAAPSLERPAAELREAALNWIEQHTEKQLNTRRLLETT